MHVMDITPGYRRFVIVIFTVLIAACGGGSASDADVEETPAISSPETAGSAPRPTSTAITPSDDASLTSGTTTARATETPTVLPEPAGTAVVADPPPIEPSPVIPAPTAVATPPPGPHPTPAPSPVPTPVPPPPTTDVPSPPSPPPDHAPTPIPLNYHLVKKVASEGGGYFGGDASSDHSLVAIAGYVSGDPAILADERSLTFFDGDGNELGKTDLGGGSWVVAMTPDGSKTVAGSDNETISVFEGTTLVAQGSPRETNGQVRGLAITDDGRYAGVGGFAFTLHDLDSPDPLQAIFEDAVTDQVRAVDFSSDGRYVVYGGRDGLTTMYLGIYDVETGAQVFTDTIEYPDGTNPELRHLSISSDASRIIAGDWAGFLHFYVRDGSQGVWSRSQSIEIGSRVYWTDIDAADQVVVVGTQGSGLQVYEIGDEELTLRWKQPGPDMPGIPGGFGGGQRQVSITRNGEYISAGTRGGGAGGGQMVVFDPEGGVLFSERSDAVKVGDVYFGANGAHPEVWFTSVSEDGERLVFASWNGYAYFYER